MRRLPVPLVPTWVRWLGVAAVAGFVFATSVLVAPPSEPVVPGKVDPVPLDKWRHFLAYAAIAYALAYALADSDRPRIQLAVGVVCLTVLYGIGIELWQWTIPNRFFSLADAYANALGAALVVAWYAIEPRLDYRPVLTVLSRGESASPEDVS
ncbi:VanZ family protein [Halorientalis halophila]|uniref:VanZ family protein n=1 Tax=Halorientalis halophila TaxID=3108499 RepID=UPI0030085D12